MLVKCVVQPSLNNTCECSESVEHKGSLKNFYSTDTSRWYYRHYSLCLMLHYGIHTGRCPAYLKDIVQQRSNTYWPAIGFQQQVLDATAANKVWRMRLLACRTCCMNSLPPDFRAAASPAMFKNYSKYTF